MKNNKKNKKQKGGNINDIPWWGWILILIGIIYLIYLIYPNTKKVNKIKRLYIPADDEEIIVNIGTKTYPEFLKKWVNLEEIKNYKQMDGYYVEIK